MKSVAIVGRGKSKAQAQFSVASEKWGIGAAYRDHDFAFDRIIEIHPRGALEHPNYNPGHWEAITRMPAGPTVVVMERAYDDIPASAPYPWDAALALCEHIRVGDARKELFTSSFDWAIALAILEGFERIELYGVDISPTVRLHDVEGSGPMMERSVSTEYVYQRPGAWGWAQFAAARGITVWTPDTSPLFDVRRYGLDGWAGAQMVTIEHVRAIQEGLRAAKIDYGNRMRVLDGQIDLPEYADQAAAMKKEVEAMRRMIYIADGAFQGLEALVMQSAIGDAVGRQMIETARQNFENQRQQRLSDLNYHLGLTKGYEDNGADATTLRKELRRQVMAVFVTIGCEQAMEWLVDDCDGKPNEYKLVNPVSEFKIGGED